jgi:crossover junction endodeoxyribonuclease RuvC
MSPARRVIDPSPGIEQTEHVFDSPVLGIDPGLTSCGLATLERRVDRPALIAALTVRTASDLAEPARLRLIHAAIREAIEEHRPGSVAIERVAWNTNQVSAMHVARATGAILLAAAEAGLPVDEYGPLEVKMAVTGQGNASKAQVRTALERFHGIRDLPDQPDAVDAVAVAVCHLTQLRLKRSATLAATR